MNTVSKYFFVGQEKHLKRRCVVAAGPLSRPVPFRYKYVVPDVKVT